MNSSIKIIKEVINWLELFTEENPNAEKEIKSFILWLTSKLFADDQSHQAINGNDTLDMEMSFLLVMQNRHYKSYSKKALADSELSSAEGFSFLYHLNLVGSYRKMELIKLHLLEPPSGIEVLKRLLKKGLIEEFDDPDDKRAKRVRISAKGKSEIDKTIPKMQDVFIAMTAEMSLNEKLHVISFLKKMNEYHVLNVKRF